MVGGPEPLQRVVGRGAPVRARTPVGSLARPPGLRCARHTRGRCGRPACRRRSMPGPGDWRSACLGLAQGLAELDRRPAPGPPTWRAPPGAGSARAPSARTANGSAVEGAGRCGATLVSPRHGRAVPVPGAHGLPLGVVVLLCQRLSPVAWFRATPTLAARPATRVTARSCTSSPLVGALCGRPGRRPDPRHERLVPTVERFADRSMMGRRWKGRRRFRVGWVECARPRTRPH